MRFSSSRSLPHLLVSVAWQCQPVDLPLTAMKVAVIFRDLLFQRMVTLATRQCSGRRAFVPAPESCITSPTRLYLLRCYDWLIVVVSSRRILDLFRGRLTYSCASS